MIRPSLSKGVIRCLGTKLYSFLEAHVVVFGYGKDELFFVEEKIRFCIKKMACFFSNLRGLRIRVARYTLFLLPYWY
jgi:hypothetical protein